MTKESWKRIAMGFPNRDSYGKLLRHIMPDFSHVIKFLSVSNQSSSLAINQKSELLFSDFAHKPLDSSKIPSLIAVFLTGYEPGARTHTSKAQN